ncbi:hypothetical protein HII36_36375 [Nonomuraea sp. NN258]|uniref:hypothetical protein n=1 Tax=Nonomuraea antri TaxID=2730852 RepID=UPI001568A5D3|nr:hypothetical protein [Nonomuraea antri]NRQ37276.1 hypothetical protein [Nonomuraea antri]
MNIRSAYVAAPLLVLAYGVLRLLDGLDGSRGPGFAWTAGHLAFMGALVLFAMTFRDMWTRGGRTRVATAELVVGLVGVACLLVQFSIDIVVGFLAADHDAMGPLFDQVQAVPGVSLAVYDAGPFLFYIAQFALVVHLAVHRAVPAWTPVLVLLGTAVPMAGLDFIPVAAVLMLVGFLPLARANAAAGRHALAHA